MTVLMIEALKKRYPTNAYAVIAEVRNCVASAKRRTGYADALVMGCWPSRGLDIQGFEFKVSRGDWLKEWRSPEKAEEFVRYCDQWWLAVSEEKIVKKEELPKNWGLLVMHGDQFKTVVEAPKLKPVEPDRAFIASILRSFIQQVLPQTLLEREYQRGQSDGFKSGEESAKTDIEMLNKRIEEIEKDHRTMIDDFEKKSGLRIGNWRAGNIAEAVARVMRSEHVQIEARLLSTKRELERLLADTNDALQRAGIKE